MTETARTRSTPVLTALIALTVVVAVAAAGWLGWRWWQRNGPAPRGVSASTGVVLGSSTAAHRIDVYLDPECPSCKSLDSSDGPRLAAAAASGDTQVRYHVLSVLDQDSTDSLSSRAANAAYCASDAGRFVPYLHALLARTSATVPAGDQQLIDIAASAGIVDKSFATCVRDGRYRPFVRRITDQARAAGVTHVPTVLEDGRTRTTDVGCSATGSCVGPTN